MYYNFKKSQDSKDKVGTLETYRELPNIIKINNYKYKNNQYIPRYVCRKGICFGARALYGSIMALAKKEGYCYAQNSYFAEQFEVCESTIGNWLRQLKNAGFIITKYYYNKRKPEMVLERRIYLCDLIVIDNTETQITKKPKIAEKVYVNTICKFPENDKTHAMWRLWRRNKRFDKYWKMRTFVEFSVGYTNSWGKKERKRLEESLNQSTKPIQDVTKEVKLVENREKEKERNQYNYRSLGAALNSFFYKL